MKKGKPNSIKAPVFAGFKLQLARDGRADAALKQILLSLLDAMEYNRPGIAEDSDPEFLHDYRIAVRRSRSLLGQFKGVFPKKDREWAMRQLAWLGAVTGPLRDIDVALLSFDDYREILPARRRDDLKPLWQLFMTRREWEYRRLNHVFASRRYQSFLNRWRGFLQAPLRRTTLYDARRPVADVADERIRKLYRRAIKQGRSACKDATPEKLHELRKTCKKLRYVIESFRALYPDAKIKKSIKIIKRLQNDLGSYQDLHVQIEDLKDLSKRGKEKDGLPESTRNAMAIVIKKLKKKQCSWRARFEKNFSIFSARKNRIFFDRLFGETG